MAQDKIISDSELANAIATCVLGGQGLDSILVRDFAGEICARTIWFEAPCRGGGTADVCASLVHDGDNRMWIRVHNMSIHTLNVARIQRLIARSALRDDSMQYLLLSNGHYHFKRIYKLVSHGINALMIVTQEIPKFLKV